MDPGSIALVAHTAERCVQTCQLIKQQVGSSQSQLQDSIEQLRCSLIDVLDIYNSEKAPVLIEVKGEQELSIHRQKLVTANENWSAALDSAMSTKDESPSDIELIGLSRQLTNTVSALFLPGTKAYEQRRQEADLVAAQAARSNAARQRQRRSLNLSSALATFVALSSALRLRTVVGYPLFGFKIGLAQAQPATDFSNPHMLVAFISYLCGLALLVQSRRLAGERQQYLYLPSAWLFSNYERLTRDVSSYTAHVGLLPLWILAAQLCCWAAHYVVRRSMKQQAKSAAHKAGSSTVSEQV